MKDAFAAMMEKKESEKKPVEDYYILKGSKQFSTDYYLSCHILQFDGGSVPNPGPSSGGAVLLKSDRRSVIFEVGDYVEYSTNNQAEYFGLWLGLKECLERGYREILIEGDSQLIIKQVAGEWKCKDPDLKQLQKTVLDLIAKFDYVAIRHVLREYNKHADALTNEVIKTKEKLLR